jgi:hypothetical protein
VVRVEALCPSEADATYNKLRHRARERLRTELVVRATEELRDDKSFSENEAAIRARAISEQNNLLFDLLNPIDLIARRLADSPILVTVGQHEVGEEQLRTYADTREQIASRLANQRRFEATGKMTTPDFVKTFQLRGQRFVLLDEAHSSTRVDSIREYSRDTYCRYVPHAVHEPTSGQLEGPPHTRRVELLDDDNGGAGPAVVKS